ncbi:MAG TPA: PaaI family thioesterase [Acidimicrobiales bacterium]|nr:PaaI family thioesterase [Acidimicrobiales bacterium]
MPRVTIPVPIMTAGELDDFLSRAFFNQRMYRVSDVTDRGVLLTIPIGPEHERPGGTVSGPTMMSLSDAAAWLATLSRIGPVALAVTTNLNINFLRKPSLDQDLTAEANLIKLGKRLSVSEVGCYSGDILVSHATVTYSIPS